MPSPFPGMDPYVESSAIWPNMHLTLIAEMRNVLNEALPDSYVANIGERVYINETAQSIGPDVFISKSNPSTFGSLFNGGGAATAVCDEPIIMEVISEEIREPFIEIVRSGGGRVVTEIEILSPSNKESGRGRDEYLRKQKNILDSDCHFLEIDLIRQGAATVACLLALPEQRKSWDYWVCLHRAQAYGKFEVWMRTVRQPLPKVSVPLAGKDPDIVIDLQAIFSRCYDLGKMSRNINYGVSPEPSLRKEDLDWAASLFQSLSKK